MRKRRLPIFGFCLVFWIIAGRFLPAFAQSDAYVRVQSCPVRHAPSFLGKVAGTLSYGTRVQVTEAGGAWTKIAVTTPSLSGWVHQSALSRKPVKLRAGTEDVSTAASSDELALAGKGFNEQVESVYRNENPGLNYKWVDEMETYRIGENKLRQFLKSGRLSPEGGL
jgi:hypothetical protein